jgi:DNA-binding NarL/FixJ family response regulator
VEKEKSSFENRQIIILGPQNLQNELFAYVLQREIGARCRIGEEIEVLAEMIDAEAEQRLMLVDCSGRNIKKTLEELETSSWKSVTAVTIALFSLQHGRGIEQNALQFGVRGFFYKDEKLPLIMKGVDTLFRGEIWLSREILVEVATTSTRKRAPTLENKAGLTSREMEILALVSVGANNEEIADKLFISPHTVKTHLYHIFKKISVPSRLQAALWAAKHL